MYLCHNCVHDLGFTTSLRWITATLPVSAASVFRYIERDFPGIEWQSIAIQIMIAVAVLADTRKLHTAADQFHKNTALYL